MKKIFNIVLVLIVTIILVGCGKKEKAGNEKFMEEYKKGDLIFKNESITKNGNTTVITSTLTNNSNEEKSIGWVKLNVIYKNVSNSEQTTDMLIYFGDRIEGNQTLQTTTIIDFDIDKIVDVKYEFVQKR